MAEKNQNGVLSNVTFAYAKLAEPTKKYKSDDLEYSIDVIVDKTTAKTWNKQFLKQKAKEYDSEEFKAAFKIDSPLGEDEDVYVIKLRKSATKDGTAFDEKFRPKVFLDTKNGERVDITSSRLIANGSVGKVSYRVTSNDKFGDIAYLQNVLMDEDGFVEYTSTFTEGGSEFGGDKPVTRVEPENTAATKARATKAANPVKATSAKVAPKKPAETEESEDDDSDQDSPF